jgi:hypothetical protein
MATIRVRHGVPVLEYPSDGPQLDVAGATDLIGETFGSGTEWVLIPAACLDEAFFRLRTGVAGEIVGKFANYHLRLAIIGDISAQVAASTALRDFVSESNRGRQLWLLESEAEFDARLAR